MSKEKKFYWGVAITSIAIIVGSILIPGEPNKPSDLPWNIQHPTPDTLKVFDLTLGVSTTNEAEKRFQEEAKPSLFKTRDGQMTVEFYYEEVNMAGLKSKIVTSVAVPPEEITGMYDRGLRMSGTGSGKKITLTEQDVAKVRTYPITNITYMPGTNVEEEVLKKRFGAPQQKVKEKETGVVHWLYPKSGLDIAMGGREKPVLQYISPKDFNKLADPLLKSGEIVN